MSATISTLVWALIVIIVVIILVVVLFKVLVIWLYYQKFMDKRIGTTFQSATGEGTVTPSIQFIPQQAWVQTIPPAGVQNTNSNSQSLTEVLIPLITGGGAFLAAKLNADKNHKANAAEILKTKENTKELARVTYDMNPDAAEKIDDAPSIKINTLTEDVNAFAEKVAKK